MQNVSGEAVVFAENKGLIAAWLQNLALIPSHKLMCYNRNVIQIGEQEEGMANDAVLQVRMDAELKRDAEQLYKRMGTSLAEAVRIFARQSVEENAMPFVVKVPVSGGRRELGIADGEFSIPASIDSDNDAIAALFGGVA